MYNKDICVTCHNHRTLVYEKLCSECLEIYKLQARA
jgi:hypothetical protein